MSVRIVVSLLNGGPPRPKPFLRRNLIANVCYEFLSARGNMEFAVVSPANRVSMIGQSGRFEPCRNGPYGNGSTGLSEAQARMCSPRLGSRAEVKGIVLVPLSNCMRMPPKETL